MPLLKAIDLTKVFNVGGSQVRALDGVSLEVRPSEFLAIMGPSGSGKSTLLHLLGALDVPTSGQIIVGQRDLGSCTDYERTLLRRRTLGFVFQAFKLVPALSAVENVMLPMLLDRQPRSSARERATEVLGIVGLAGAEQRRPATLSGGEQQRVAIARALAIRPAVLLADEPTGSLDSVNGQQIIELFRQLVTSHGVAVVMVTHDAGLAEQADRSIHLRDGRLDPAHASATLTAAAPS